MPRTALSVLSPSGARFAADPGRDFDQLLQGGLLRSHPPKAGWTARPGLDFASRDCLGLARHPTVRAAALAANGGSPTDPVRALEARLADLLQLPGARCFGSGSEAIRQTFAVVLSPEDDLLLDSGAPAAMVEAALASGARLHGFPSGPVEAAERRLVRLARQSRRGRLVIAVAAVSDHGSKHADLAELSALARLHGALLIADVSQDFGAMGQMGRGVMELQGCLGRVDIVLGSLARCFGADGGFAACRDPDLAARLRCGAQVLPLANANSLLAATGIAFGPEGQRRRQNLQGVSLRLRNHLMADGLRVMGSASPLVPVLLPPDTALPRTALLESAGPRVTLLQAPEVPPHAPRWRIQLGAHHRPADIDDLAELIRDVSRAFDRTARRERVAV